MADPTYLAPDLPPGVPVYAGGAIAQQPVPIPIPTVVGVRAALPPSDALPVVAPTNVPVAPPSLTDRAVAASGRAMDGIRSLLGMSPVSTSAPAPAAQPVPTNRTAELEANLNALQRRSSPNVFQLRQGSN